MFILNKHTLFLFILFIILFYASSVYAQNTIYINEFVIEPSQSVELLNISTTAVDISKWFIDDNGGTTYFTIPQNTILSPNSCIIFSADFNLNKSSPDILRLFDSSNDPTSSSTVLIDSFSYKSSPGQNIGFSRMPDGSTNWATTSASLGIFNSTGISCLIIPIPTPTPTSNPSTTPTPLPTSSPAPTQTPSPTPLPNYNNIYISEVMVYPESGQNEWVEIYNANDFQVYLTNWYLDDIPDAGSSPRLISATIPAKSLIAIDLTSSLFNNSGDSVRLLDQNKIEINKIDYDFSEQGKSWGKTDLTSSSPLCLQTPSKNNTNNTCTISEDSTSTPTPKISTVTGTTKQGSVKSSSSTKSTTTSSFSSNNTATYRHYAIAVTPPTIRMVDHGYSTPNILGANTNTDALPDHSFSEALFMISGSYSLLSILSIGTKLIKSPHFLA